MLPHHEYVRQHECVSCGKNMRFVSEPVTVVFGFICDDCLQTMRVRSGVGAIESKNICNECTKAVNCQGYKLLIESLSNNICRESGL